MAGCFSTLIRAPTAPPFLLRGCANFSYRKAHGFFGRKRCWAWIQIKGRDLSRQVGAIDLNRPRAVQVNGPYLSNPSNPTRAFARASLSRVRKLRKDIFALPASSCARTAPRFDLCHEREATISRQEIRKSRPAFPAFDRENFRTLRCTLVLAEKI